MIHITLPTNYKTAKPRDVKNRKEYDKPGVYVFFNSDDTALYVGKSVSFKRRFCVHAANSPFFREASYVRLYEMDTDYERDIYETEMIRQFDPLFNKAKQFHRQVEIEQELAEIKDNAQQLIEEINELRDELNALYDEADAAVVTGDRTDVDGGSGSLEKLGEVLYIDRRISELRAELARLYRKKQILIAKRN
ncbi:GIY-YIG nuclease family protein [Bacillus subtilis]|uniref:Excinuclease cho n=1 Tax=Bacillus subtilis TaxID=1423 RepID=A0AAX3RJ48_BACIU|nr:GIY-YIG nuclease family protein [Bacillus subtilis]